MSPIIFRRWARLQQKGPRKGEKLKDVMEKLGEVLPFSSMSEQEWRDGPVEVLHHEERIRLVFVQFETDYVKN